MCACGAASLICAEDYVYGGPGRVSFFWRDASHPALPCESALLRPWPLNGSALDLLNVERKALPLLYVAPGADHRQQPLRPGYSRRLRECNSWWSARVDEAFSLRIDRRQLFCRLVKTGSKQRLIIDRKASSSAPALNGSEGIKKTTTA